MTSPAFSARILVVDDELSLRELLEIFLSKLGHRVQTASDGAAAIRTLIEEEEFDLVLTDLRMPGAHGMVVLEKCRELHPETPIIVMTAFSTTQTAIEAMKVGAYDYFQKPFKMDEAQIVIDRALDRRRLVVESRRMRDALDARSAFEPIIGQSRAMAEVFDLVRRIAKTRTNVLILGESGTGKELVARAIHEQSDRRTSPFLVINCGAIPENLIESELFGHKKGAFTGAHADKDGLFRAAQGGTLMLDEIGELPLGMQVKLLRALQERRVRPVGDVREHPVDVRVVAATNRDLEAEVRAGRFREDLYYRLNVIGVQLPPLRERAGDIPQLAFHFLRRFAQEQEKAVLDIEPDALRALQEHTWPGNVRELENAMERSVALEESDRVSLRSLPAAVRARATSPTTQSAEGLELPSRGLDLEDYVDAVERRLITQALTRAAGVKKDAAKLLGITFRSLRYRLAKLNMETGPDEGDGE
jgi:two-component system response regulator PilR (NtrC family)